MSSALLNNIFIIYFTLILIESSFVASKRLEFDSDNNRILSNASEALEMSSLR